MMRRRPSKHRKVVIYIMVCVAIVFSAIHFWNSNESPNVGGLDLTDTFPLDHFMKNGEEPISGSSITLPQPNGNATIHQAHTNGSPHSGAWVFVRSDDGAILFLKRGRGVRTCPNTWAVIGEHRLPGEESSHLAVRAVTEELGGPELVSASLKNAPITLTETPVWERHDYPDGRIDREVSDLLYIQLSKNYADINFGYDSDTASHRWVSISNARQWIKDTPSDFCDGAIVKILDLGLTQLELQVSGAGRWRPSP